MLKKKLKVTSGTYKEEESMTLKDCLTMLMALCVFILLNTFLYGLLFLVTQMHPPNEIPYDEDLKIDAYLKFHSTRNETIISGNKLVCYYNYPTVFRSKDELQPEDINSHLCTHIIIGFASIRNSLVFFDNNMKVTISRLLKLKIPNPNLKILVSVGGGMNNSGFPEMVQKRETRRLFINSILGMLYDNQLDGIDLDWEFPDDGKFRQNLKNKKNKMHFTQLLREIRGQFIKITKPYLLTVAVASPEPIVLASYDVVYMNMYVDFINLMSYDYHFYSKSTPYTGFNAPLYPKMSDFFITSILNINYSAEMWVAMGMDREKVTIGLPTYGHSYHLINPDNNHLNSPADGYGKLGLNGFVQLSDICDVLNKNGNVLTVFDNETLSPYLTFDSEWISYENDDSIIHKVNYVKNGGFGGVMVYSLNNDDYLNKCGSTKFYLVNKINDTLFKDFKLNDNVEMQFNFNMRNYFVVMTVIVFISLIISCFSNKIKSFCNTLLDSEDTAEGENTEFVIHYVIY